MRITKNYDGTVQNGFGELIPSEYGNNLAPGEQGEISNLHHVSTWNEITSHSSGGAQAMPIWPFWLGVWVIAILDFCYGFLTTGSGDAALRMVAGHLWLLIKGFFLLILFINSLALGTIIYIWTLFFG